jgi:hypothetical protein
MVESDDEEIPSELAEYFAGVKAMTGVTVWVIAAFFANRREGHSPILSRLELLDLVDSNLADQPRPVRDAVADHLDKVIKAINLGLTHGEGA